MTSGLFLAVWRLSGAAEIVGFYRKNPTGYGKVAKPPHCVIGFAMCSLASES
jgi:hypothetical protein